MKCILYYYIVYFIPCLIFLFVFYLFLGNTCSNSLLICLNQLTPYMAPGWGNDPKISSQSIRRQMREMNRLQSRAISKCLRGFHPWEINSIFFLLNYTRISLEIAQPTLLPLEDNLPEKQTKIDQSFTETQRGMLITFIRIQISQIFSNLYISTQSCVI